MDGAPALELLKEDVDATVGWITWHDVQRALELGTEGLEDYRPSGEAAVRRLVRFMSGAIERAMATDPTRDSA